MHLPNDTAIPFEERNLEAYRFLLRIEVAIRELLREAFEEEYGPKWRNRLPSDLLSKVRDSEREEHRANFDFQRLGPLYYLTLGELAPILQQKVGTGIKKLLGNHFLPQLTSIFPLRNALAHCRGISSNGLLAINAVYRQLESALQASGRSSIWSSPDVGLHPSDIAPALKQWLLECERNIRGLTFIPAEPNCLLKARQQYWWESPELAGFNTTLVDNVVTLLTGYARLSGGIASAAIRQSFADEKALLEQLRLTILTLSPSS